MKLQEFFDKRHQNYADDRKTIRDTFESKLPHIDWSEVILNGWYHFKCVYYFKEDEFRLSKDWDYLAPYPFSSSFFSNWVDEIKERLSFLLNVVFQVGSKSIRLTEVTIDPDSNNARIARIDFFFEISNEESI